MTDFGHMIQNFKGLPPGVFGRVNLSGHSDEPSLERLLDTLVKTKNCCSLYLEKVKISSKSRKLVNKVLRTNQGIENLTIINTKINPLAVLESSAVRRLFLQGLSLSAANDKHLNKWIIRNCPLSIHMIDLEIGRNSIDTLLKDSWQVASLDFLTLSNLDLNGEVVKGSLPRLVAEGSLISLDLRSSRLQEEDWDCLSNALTKNSTIFSLDISGTNITKAGANGFVNYLSGDCKLQIFRAKKIMKAALLRLCENLAVYRLREFIVDENLLSLLDKHTKQDIYAQIENNYVLEKFGNADGGGDQFQTLIRRNWVLERQPKLYGILKRNLEDNKLTSCCFARLTILGQEGSGKTSLLSSLAMGLTGASATSSKNDFHTCLLELNRTKNKERKIDWSTRTSMNYQFRQVLTAVRGRGGNLSKESLDYSLPDEDTAIKFVESTGIFDCDSLEEANRAGVMPETSERILNIWDIGQWNQGLQIQSLFSVSNSTYLLTFNALDVLEDAAKCIRELIGIATRVKAYTENVAFIFVGTRADKIDRSNEKVVKTLENFENEFYKATRNLNIAVVYRCGTSTSALYVDNTCTDVSNRSDDLLELQVYVSKMTNPHDFTEGDWGVSIVKPPRFRVRWLSLLVTITKEDKPVIFYSDILSRCERFGIPRSDCRQMIRTLSEAGTLLWLIPPGSLPAEADILNTLVCVQPSVFFKVFEEFSKQIKRLSQLKMSLEDSTLLNKYGMVSDEWLEKMLPSDAQQFFPVLTYLLQNSMLITTSFAFKHKHNISQRRLVPFALDVKPKVEPLLDSEQTFYISCKGLPRMTIYQKLICYFVSRTAEQGKLEHVDFSAEWTLFPKLYREKGILIDFHNADMIRISALLSANGIIDYVVRLTEECLDRIRGNDQGTSILLPAFKNEKEYLIPLDDIDSEALSVGFAGEYFSKSHFAHFFTSQKGEKKTSVVPEDTTFDCFLSHSWGKDQVNHKQVIEISKILEHGGFKCWLDESNMGSDLVQSMTEGIDNSKLFVVFLSKAYIERLHVMDTNVYKEFNYAAATIGVGRFIVISIEPEVEELLYNRMTRPRNYFFNCSNKMRYDWSSQEAMEANLPRVLKYMRKKLIRISGDKSLQVVYGEDPFSLTSFESKGDDSGLGTTSEVLSLYQSALNRRIVDQNDWLGLDEELYQPTGIRSYRPNATTALALKLAAFSLSFALSLAMRLDKANPIRARALSFISCFTAEMTQLTKMSVSLESAKSCENSTNTITKASVNDLLLRMAVHTNDDIFAMVGSVVANLNLEEREFADNDFGGKFMREVLKLRDVNEYGMSELYGTYSLETNLMEFGWEKETDDLSPIAQFENLIKPLENIELKARRGANQFYWDVDVSKHTKEIHPQAPITLSVPGRQLRVATEYEMTQWLAALCKLFRTYNKMVLNHRILDSVTFAEIKVNSDCLKSWSTTLKELTAKEQPFLQTTGYFDCPDNFWDWLERPQSSCYNSSQWSRSVDVSCIQQQSKADMLTQVEIQVFEKLLGIKK